MDTNNKRAAVLVRASFRAQRGAFDMVRFPLCAGIAYDS
jgi:hypothetical protein